MVAVPERRARLTKGAAERDVEIEEPTHGTIRLINLNSQRRHAYSTLAAGSSWVAQSTRPPFPINGAASWGSLWTVTASQSLPT